VSERNLSRRVAASVVEALKANGHILVVKGGSEALVRELDALMAEQLTQVSPGVTPRAVVGEVTSTFGDEAIDEAIEDMVGTLAKALMDSDHVEDVFAEDNVIRRDVFRVVRDTLLQISGDTEEPEEEAAGPISVRLDTLGYVASTVAKRADDETLRDALERAALAAEGQLASYDKARREALFKMSGGDPDGRLELEEAVADELTDLVDMGLVELPSIERRFELSRELGAAERTSLKPRIDAVASRTLMRAGCAASWEFADGRALQVTLTPLSEQDARGAEQHAALFAREIDALLTEAPSPPSSKRAEAAPPSTQRAPTGPEEPQAAAEETKPATRRAGKEKPAAKRAAPKRTKKAEQPKAPPSSRKAPPSSRKAPPSSRKAAPPSSKPASKRASASATPAKARKKS